MERHDSPHTNCAQGYCCGCDEHPIGKPWGWNFTAWERHYDEAHPGHTESTVEPVDNTST